MSDHAETAADHANDDHSHDVNLWQIGGYMIVLTLATFVTLYIPRGIWGSSTNLLFVLMIAFAKATLVVGFFMHYKYEQAWKYALTIPPMVLAVAAVFALLPDVAVGAYPKALWVFTN